MTTLSSKTPPISMKPILVVFALGILFAANSVILFPAHAATVSFTAPINLSNDTGKAKQPAVSNNGQNVYIAWTEGSSGIRFRASSNGGLTWNPPTSSRAMRLGPTSGSAQFPVMIAADGYQPVAFGDVYVAWSQTVSGVLQVFIASSTNNGSTFTTVQISTGGGITPALAGWGHDAYVSWYQNANCPGMNGSGCIWVSSSNNDGGSWSTPVELFGSLAGEQQIVAWQHNVYLVADGVDFTASHNDGLNWTTPVVLYGIYLYGSGCATFSSPCVYSVGREPWIAASGLNVYVTFNAIDLASPPNATGIGSSKPVYRIYGLYSNDSGATWNPTTPIIDPTSQSKYQFSSTLKNDWEPENIAFNSSTSALAVLTFHSVSNQGIYLITSTNGGTSWSSPKIVNPTGRTSSFAHVFTSDGTDVFAMWGQKISSSSSVWNAYVVYSGDSGITWSSPIDISNNPVGVAAGNQDVTLIALSANGIHCFAVWTYTNGSTSQIYFSAS